MRDGAVLTAGSEEVMLKFVRTAKEWQKKWKYSEMERQRLSVVLNEKEIELTGKDYQVNVHFNSRQILIPKRDLFQLP